MRGEKGFLDTAYGLDNAGETREFYRQWAKTYDDEIRANGYQSPQRVAAAMADVVPDKDAPLLDLGCGTGLSGEALAAKGFTTIDGADFSKEMLAGAATKGLYRHLTQSDLNTPVPAQPGDYTNITAVGVFSPGHAPANTIDAVLAVLPPGGCFGFTLNDHALEEKTYEDKVRDVCSNGNAEISFNGYGPHLPARSIGARIYVLRKLSNDTT